MFCLLKDNMLFFSNLKIEYDIFSGRQTKIKVQWNLPKADTYGTEVFVRFKEVSALERFELKSSQI